MTERRRDGRETVKGAGTFGREPIVPLITQSVPVGIQRSVNALVARRQAQINLRMARPQGGCPGARTGWRSRKHDDAFGVVTKDKCRNSQHVVGPGHTLYVAKGGGPSPRLSRAGLSRDRQREARGAMGADAVCYACLVADLLEKHESLLCQALGGNWDSSAVE